MKFVVYFIKKDIKQISLINYFNFSFDLINMLFSLLFISLTCFLGKYHCLEFFKELVI